MKFCFFSTDGALIFLLLMFSTSFCIQGVSAEANDTHEISGSVDIPCSLDDRNRTDCNSSSPVSSGSPELWTAPNLNSSDVSDVPCPSDGCSTNNEQGINTTSHEFSSVSALDNVSEIVNQTETTVMTEHFTSSAVLNETTTLCPLEGCLESNRSEVSMREPLTPLVNSSNVTDFETTRSVTTTLGLNETVSFITSNNNDSAVVTPETTEISNFTETTELTAPEDEMITTEGHKNFSVTTTELSNASSTLHTVEAGNSTETNMTTEHPLVTDEERNTSVSTISPTTEPVYNTTDHVENTTVFDYPLTRTESLPDTATNATSLDNTTLFHTPSADSNSSTSVNENTESSTNASVTNITTTEYPVSPQTVHIIVELRNNCSDSGREREIALLMAQLLNATLRNDYSKGCHYLHNVSLSIMHGPIDLVTIRRILSERLRGVEIVRVIYDEGGTHKDVIPPPPDNDITQSEMILYITLGVSLGAIFLIALAIICFKCCRRHPSKPVDLDVPHLNLRLEDYTLTRIPRPNTCYLDYFRGPIVNEHYSSPSVRSSMNAASESNRGMVQPFDTSVVPLEDAKKLDQLATSPNRTSCPSTPLRTFGRKDWKNGDRLIYENVISSSTEKLHPDFYKYGYAGTENPTFAA